MEWNRLMTELKLSHLTASFTWHSEVLQCIASSQESGHLGQLNWSLIVSVHCQSSPPAVNLLSFVGHIQQSGLGQVPIRLIRSTSGVSQCCRRPSASSTAHVILLLWLTVDWRCPTKSLRYARPVIISCVSCVRWLDHCQRNLLKHWSSHSYHIVNICKYVKRHSRQCPHCSENKHSTWRQEFLGRGSENLEQSTRLTAAAWRWIWTL